MGREAKDNGEAVRSYRLSENGSSLLQSDAEYGIELFLDLSGCAEFFERVSVD